MSSDARSSRSPARTSVHSDDVLRSLGAPWLVVFGLDLHGPATASHAAAIGRHFSTEAVTWDARRLHTIAVTLPDPNGASCT